MIFSIPEGSSCWECWGWTSWELPSYPLVAETGCSVFKRLDS